jgi:APA family basic amino acid/polyamine antiporter
MTSQLKPELSLLDAAAIVAGSMIGSGIFIVSADITRQVASPAGLLTVWLVSGLMTIAGALAYGELAAMMPHAGGQYVFLREAYGEALAFSFGWTLLLVIQTGTIAAVAVAFARFAGILWPALGSNKSISLAGVPIAGERLGAIAVIALLTAINLRGIRLGKIVQNGFTSAKVLSLLMIILVCCFVAPNRSALEANFGSSAAFFGSRPLSLGLFAAFGSAMVGGLFSSDAWGSVTFAASEVRDPRQNLARALALGTIVVIVLYLLTNLAYLCELPALSRPGTAHDPVHRLILYGIAGAPGDRVGSAAMSVVWGRAGATLTALLVMVSTFGCANGLILPAPA